MIEGFLKFFFNLFGLMGIGLLGAFIRSYSFRKSITDKKRKAGDAYYSDIIGLERLKDQLVGWLAVISIVIPVLYFTGVL
jgi:hypothetical protein